MVCRGGGGILIISQNISMSCVLALLLLDTIWPGYLRGMKLNN